MREQIAFLVLGKRARSPFAAAGERVEKPIEPLLLLEKAAALLKEAEAKKTQAA